ncbi:hypothetical protein, partial [Mesorhizobium sp. M0011]|uniref:hypothetical protein n=1 Tax=Mesorhizobium sp. M0011 TaxID=2956839 RepID=UPI0033375CEB
QHGRPARAQEARSTPSRMTSFMIAHFAELDAHNPQNFGDQNMQAGSSKTNQRRKRQYGRSSF